MINSTKKIELINICLHKFNQMLHQNMSDTKDFEHFNAANEDLFKNIKSVENIKPYNELMTITIPQIACKFYENRLVCVDLTGREYYEYAEYSGTWKDIFQYYEFKNHRWTKVDTFITEDLIIDNIINILRAYFTKNMTTNDNSSYLKSYFVPKIISELKMISNKIILLSNIRKRIHKGSDFLIKLDLDPNLICFDNGVYDIKKGILRDGVPTDYVSMSIGYDWIEYKDDRGNKESILRCVQNHSKNIQILKSVLNGIYDKNINCCIRDEETKQMLESILGDYVMTTTINILPEKKHKYDTTQLYYTREMQGKRLLIIDAKNNPEQSLFSSRMMKLTGNDEVVQKPLYGHPFMYTKMFKTILLCGNDENSSTTKLEKIKIDNSVDRSLMVWLALRK
jgi:hypothetical protein